MPGPSRPAPRLRELRQRLLLLAGRVELMAAHAVQAVVERDVELAHRTMAADEQVNRDEVETDALCRAILAERRLQPAELRFVTQALKMVTDLERLGDLAVNICERAVHLAALPPLKPWVDVPRMADIAQTMIRDAVDSFVQRDLPKARSVLARDDEVDRLYAQVQGDLLRLMSADQERVPAGLHADAVARWIERMADHATNLAEHVIFLLAGEDVRHRPRPDATTTP